jgi:DNA adenine methylase
MPTLRQTSDIAPRQPYVEPLVPFLKWAGGKRWLIASHPELFPKRYQTYIEPFLGSGAVYFHMCPQTAILSDCNADLIETYRAICDDWQGVQKKLYSYQSAHTPELYYATRDARPRTPTTRAARFLYLNRTCWNGLYRVNRKGRFNVPVGTKTAVILDTDDFERISETLRGAELVCTDFEATLNRAEKGDFVFIDPPYTVAHNYNGFIKYNDNLFSWSDQERLRDAVAAAASRRAHIVLLNAHHESLLRLYAGIGTIRTLTRYSVLSGNARYRKPVEELAVICNAPN